MPKHKHGSVERNLLKRRLRELVRTRLLPRLADQRPAMDVVIRAFPEAYDARFDALTRQVERAGDRLQRGGSAAGPRRPAPGPAGDAEPR